MRFIILIKGGSPTDENREEVMAKWQKWTEDMKASGAYESGHPFEEAGKEVSGNGVTEYTSEIGGYVVVNTDDMDKATELSKSIPNIEYGGKVSVHEIMEMGE